MAQRSTRTPPRRCATPRGTTGNPKGALYSHRSTVLHTYAAALPDALNCSARDAILPVVPMFHVNAWGLPYVGAAWSAPSWCSPARALDGKSLHELFESREASPCRPACPPSGRACSRTSKPNNLQLHAPCAAR